MIKNSKTISPIIAVSMLIIVAVVSVVGFQSWFETYSDTLYSDLEFYSTSSFFTIDTIVGEDLYVFNGFNTNITINFIKIDNVDCNINDEYDTGIQEINISSCIHNLTNNVFDVVVFTNKGVFSKTMYLENINTDEVIEQITLNCANISNGLVALWHFDNNLYDYSGNDFHFFHYGTNNGTYQDLGSGNASLVFNGVSDYYSLDHNSLLVFDEYTVVMRIKPEDSSTSGQILNKDYYNADTGQNDNANYRFQFYPNETIHTFYETSGGDNYAYTASDILSTTSYENVILTREDVVGGYNLSNYYNGTRVGSSLEIGTPSILNTYRVYMGVSYVYSSGFDYYLNASIDELALYNRVLTNEEIALINSKSSKICSLVSNNFTKIFQISTEDGIDDWTNVVGSIDLRTGGPDPYEGTNYFFGGANVATTAKRYLKLPSEYDYSTGNLELMLAWNQASWDSDDKGRIGVEFLNSSNSSLGAVSYDSSTISVVPSLTWLQKYHTTSIPIDSDGIYVYYDADRVAGTNLDAYVDDISIYLFSN